MKRFLTYFLTAAFAITSVLAYADFTAKKDNTAPPLGRFEIINIKTGASGQVTTSGETLTIDETNLTGVNWQAMNAAGVAGVNWTGAQITGNGINWQSTYSIPAGGINWNQYQSWSGNTAINWALFTGYNGLAEIATNWQSMAFASSGINWTGSNISATGINWTDQINQISNAAPAGVNWAEIGLTNSYGGINWLQIDHASATNTVACWNATGQLSKCLGTVSGTTCNCV